MGFDIQEAGEYLSDEEVNEIDRVYGGKLEVRKLIDTLRKDREALHLMRTSLFGAMNYQQLAHEEMGLTIQTLEKHLRPTVE